MANEDTNLQKVEPSPIKQAIEMGSRGLALASIDDAWRFATILVKSGICPKDYIGKPESVLIAIQMGAEVGLPPMASLQNIAVINGRPSLWGDGALAVVQAHPQYEWHREFFEGDRGKDERTAVFQIKRKGHEVHETRFSIADAKQAKLFGKDTYQSYPDRMIQMRARGFGMRDKFADALRGMITAEEAQDYPGVTINAAKIEQEDTEKPLREEAEAILKAKGFNEAQRTIRLGKNAGRMAEYLESLKQDATTTKAEAGTAASNDGNASANSTTPEGQSSVASEQSRDSSISGVVTGAESERRQSEQRPSGPEKLPPSAATPAAAKPPQQPASSARSQKGGRNGFVF